MSKGSERVTIRIGAALREQIRVEITSQNEHSANSPETITDFILRAIAERIAHRKRSRAKRRPAAGVSQQTWPEEVVRLAEPSNPKG